MQEALIATLQANEAEAKNLGALYLVNWGSAGQYVIAVQQKPCRASGLRQQHQAPPVGRQHTACLPGVLAGWLMTLWWQEVWLAAVHVPCVHECLLL